MDIVHTCIDISCFYGVMFRTALLAAAVCGCSAEITTEWCAEQANSIPLHRYPQAVTWYSTALSGLTEECLLLIMECVCVGACLQLPYHHSDPHTCLLFHSSSWQAVQGHALWQPAPCSDCRQLWYEVDQDEHSFALRQINSIPWWVVFSWLNWTRYFNGGTLRMLQWVT